MSKSSISNYFEVQTWIHRVLQRHLSDQFSEQRVQKPSYIYRLQEDTVSILSLGTLKEVVNRVLLGELTAKLSNDHLEVFKG